LPSVERENSCKQGERKSRAGRELSCCGRSKGRRKKKMSDEKGNKLGNRGGSKHGPKSKDRSRKGIWRRYPALGKKSLKREKRGGVWEERIRGQVSW